MAAQEGGEPMSPDRSRGQQNLPRHSPAAEKGFRDRIRMLLKWARTILHIGGGVKYIYALILIVVLLAVGVFYYGSGDDLTETLVEEVATSDVIEPTPDDTTTESEASGTEEPNSVGLPAAHVDSEDAVSRDSDQEADDDPAAICDHDDVVAYESWQWTAGPFYLVEDGHWRLCLYGDESSGEVGPIYGGEWVSSDYTIENGVYRFRVDGKGFHEESGIEYEPWTVFELTRQGDLLIGTAEWWSWEIGATDLGVADYSWELIDNGTETVPAAATLLRRNAEGD